MIKGHPSNCNCVYCDPIKFSKRIKEIIKEIDCEGFFACPGSDVKKIDSMRTCRNCQAKILLSRMADKIINN